MKTSLTIGARRAVCLLCGAGLVLGCCGFSWFEPAAPSAESAPQQEASSTVPFLSLNRVSSDRNSDQGRLLGLYVESQGNREYPLFAPVSGRSLSQQASRITEMALEAGYNSIFYPVTAQGKSMYRSKYLPVSPYFSESGQALWARDPFDILCQAAEEQNLSVCAVVDPFSFGPAGEEPESGTLPALHPDWMMVQGGNYYLDIREPEAREWVGQLCQELVSKYPIAGIVIQLPEEYPTSLSAISLLPQLRLCLQECFRSIKKTDNLVKLGLGADVSLALDTPGALFLEELSVNRVVEFLLPTMSLSSNELADYRAALQAWSSCCSGTRTRVFTQNMPVRAQSPSTDGLYYSDPNEIQYQLLLSRMAGISGCVMQSYRSLVMSYDRTKEDLQMVLSPQEVFSSLPWKLPSGFFLGSLQKAVHTEKDTYCITGVCRPESPLYLNGELVQNVSDWGGFGIPVTLQPGTNTFTLTQNDETRVATIIRDTEQSKAEQAISTIQPDSVFPQHDAAISTSKEAILECIAPSGGKVTASFKQVFVELVQEDPTIPEGLPARYVYAVDLSRFATYDVINMGRVIYSLTYNGSSTIQKSPASLYVTAPSRRLSVEITEELAPVYTDAENTQVSHFLLRGTRDYILGVKGSSYKLSSGGYLPIDSAKLIAETVAQVEKTVKNIFLQPAEGGEYLSFIGASGLPLTIEYDQEARALRFRLSNASSVPVQIASVGSSLFGDASFQKEGKSVTVTLPLQPEAQLLGCDYSFQGDTLTVFCKSAEPLEGNLSSQSLNGVTIVLDPGKGGEGEVSPLGSNGPSDDQLNLAICQLLEEKLEQRGAEVYLTRYSDTPINQLDRIMLGQFKEADLYLSIHHDSEKLPDGEPKISLSSNDIVSSEVIEASANRIALLLDRPVELVQQPDDLLHAVVDFPALRLDLGNLQDPEQLAQLGDPVSILRTACALTDEITRFFTQG